MFSLQEIFLTFKEFFESIYPNIYLSEEVEVTEDYTQA